MKVITADRCRMGDSGKIVELDTQDRTILVKLMSLGIVPGARIRVLRTNPGVILQSGHTKVALDQHLASFIVLEKK